MDQKWRGEFQGLAIGLVLLFALGALQQGLELSETGKRLIAGLVLGPVPFILFLAFKERCSIAEAGKKSVIWAVSVIAVVLASGGLASCFYEIPSRIVD